MSKNSQVSESRLIARNMARELSVEEADFVSAAIHNPKGTIRTASTSTCGGSDNQSCDLDWDDKHQF